MGVDENMVKAPLSNGTNQPKVGASFILNVHVPINSIFA